MLNIIAFKLGAIHLLRSHGGGGGGLVKTNDSTDRLREWDSNKGGRGSKNPKIMRT